MTLAVLDTMCCASARNVAAGPFLRRDISAFLGQKKMGLADVTPYGTIDVNPLVPSSLTLVSQHYYANDRTSCDLFSADQNVPEHWDNAKRCEYINLTEIHEIQYK